MLFYLFCISAKSLNEILYMLSKSNNLIYDSRITSYKANILHITLTPESGEFFEL